MEVFISNTTEKADFTQSEFDEVPQKNIKAIFFVSLLIAYLNPFPIRCNIGWS